MSSYSKKVIRTINIHLLLDEPIPKPYDSIHDSFSNIFKNLKLYKSSIFLNVVHFVYEYGDRVRIIDYNIINNHNFTRWEEIPLLFPISNDITISEMKFLFNSYFKNHIKEIGLTNMEFSSLESWDLAANI